jgi:RNA polymerase sigma-70 factor (sigma-E family)
VSDRPEYDRFVAERSPRLLRVAYLITRDWATAEDLLQSALVKAWFAWARVDGDPEAYVRRIIVTTHLSWRRRRWVGEVPQHEPAAGWADRAQADPAGAYADRDALWRALGQLPRRQRTILVLRFFEDLSEAQTAELLGVTVGTVKSQCSKALAKLRGAAELRPFIQELIP